MSMEMVDKFDDLVVVERCFVVNGRNRCRIAAAVVGVSGGDSSAIPCASVLGV